jgi:hypothetical protein
MAALTITPALQTSKGGAAKNASKRHRHCPPKKITCAQRPMSEKLQRHIPQTEREAVVFA